MFNWIYSYNCSFVFPYRTISWWIFLYTHDSTSTILLGTPIVPIMRGWPIKLRRSVIIKIMQNRIVRKTLWFLTRPLISLLAYSVLLWVWHLPNFYEAAIKHEAIHQLEHFTFLITSAIYWSVIIDPKPLQTYVAYSKRILIILAGAVQNIALGAYITTGQIIPGIW